MTDNLNQPTPKPVTPEQNKPANDPAVQAPAQQQQQAQIPPASAPAKP